MKKALFLLFFLPIYYLHAQQWEWAKRIGGWCDQPSLVAANNTGDVFTARNFNWNGQDLCTLTNISRRTSSGQVVWNKTIGAVNNWATARAIVIDNNNNNVYIAGMFTNTVKVFLICFDSTGNQKWLKIYANSDYYGIFLRQDNNGDLILASYTALPSNFLTITKLSSDGNEIWLKTFSTTLTIFGILTDSQNNIYVGAYTSANTLVIDSINYYYDTIYYHKSFLTKFNTLGELENIEIIPGCRLYNFEIDSDDNIFISGNYYDLGMKVRQLIIPPINPCGYDCHRFFVAKLGWDYPDKNPKTCVWFKETGSTSYRSSLAVSASGDLFVSGISLLFDSVQSQGKVSIFKFDSDGIVQWVQSNGGIDNAQPYDIAFSESQSVYVTGFYSNYSAGYNDTFWFGNDTLPNVGSIGDIFLAKLNDNQMFPSSDKEQIINHSFFTIFPNPASGKFTIQTTEKISSITITNLLGEIIYQTNNPTTIIDIASQNTGIYFYQINSEEKIYSGKLMND